MVEHESAKSTTLAAIRQFDRWVYGMGADFLVDANY